MWHVDTLARARERRNVAIIGLTIEDPDPLAARGAIRDFWWHFRKRYGHRAYFSWAELQGRGAVHYHAIVPNAPWRLARHFRRWVKAHWPHSRLQPSYETRDWSWFARSAGRYVKKYAKKEWTPHPRGGARLPANSPAPPINCDTYGRARSPERLGLNLANDAPRKGVHYQQDYDLLPREIRTWQSNRRAYAVAELERHIDVALTENTAPAGCSYAVWKNSWWYIGQRRHEPWRRAGCNLPPYQKRSGQSGPGALSGKDSGGNITKELPVDESRPVEHNTPSTGHRWGQARLL